MNVVFYLFGEIIVDNQLDVRNVQASAGHIGCHKDLDLSQSELGECFISVDLNFVSVDAYTPLSFHLKVLTNLLTVNFSLDKNESSFGGALQVLYEFPELLSAGHYFNFLTNRLINRSLEHSNL